MTITSEDIEEYDETTREFQNQPEEDMCAPTAIKNIMDELGERRGVDFNFSISDLCDMGDYRNEFATDFGMLVKNLNPQLEDYGYEIKLVMGISEKDIKEIIQDEKRSLPIISVSDNYFEEGNNTYDPRRGSSGSYNWEHILTIFEVNHDEVLYYDTFHDIFNRRENLGDSNIEKKMSKTLLYQLWTETGRWGCWIAKTGQRTLSSPEFRE